ncbi:glycoside hydrolase family 2 TIM barrel-domain containing protein [Saccharibacillus deserti]|uniref:glycoside hydrolase family 2 TIM barrel-domain containing protein n=1 Tax=Saccharibacillus deserti TaxID=1634444 RepID=UPI001FE68818|nr:glycoside hydrolase family 2 TIM barrel-domain containing protein [Saccharibacillus deserti]
MPKKEAGWIGEGRAAGQAGGLRSRISLNGEWEFMPLYDRPRGLSLPDKIRYEREKVRVPSSWRGSYEPEPGRTFGRIAEYGFELFAPFGYPPEWDRAEAGVLRRMVDVPREFAGRRIVLRLDGVMQQAAVYLDGRKLAAWRDGYLPLRLDITHGVRAGETHELQVVCAGFDQAVLPSGALKVTGLTGSWFGYLARGLWQDVWLESLPIMALERIAIRTSVRQNRLDIDAFVGRLEEETLPSGIEKARFTVKLTVRRRDRPDDPPVLAAETSLAAWDGEEGEGRPGESEPPRLCQNDKRPMSGAASLRLDWSGAELWSPDSPVLYTAELELCAAGETIDRLEESFGFREFWSEGPIFRLNGIPLRLRGDSWHFQGPMQQTEEYVRTWYAMCREVGVNCIRLHAEPYPEYFLRIADETGMLIVDETAIYGSGKSMAADHPDYILNTLEHAERLVLRDRNHPSVILWSVENEMRWVDGRDEYKRHIPFLIDRMRRLDPTRPIMAEGDNRLLAREQTEVESRHYNIDGTISQWDRKVPLTFGEHGGWWYICPQNASMYTGMKAYRHTDEAAAGLAEKERLFVEYARRQDVSGLSTFNFAHYFMRAMPERDIPLEWNELESPGVKPAFVPAYSLTLNNGLLPPEYPAYRPNPAFAVMREAFRPAALIAAEYDHSFYDDSPIVRRFDVYNDTLRARDVRIEFEAKQGGYTIRCETIRFRQQPAERKLAVFQWVPERVVARPGDTACAAGLTESESRESSTGERPLAGSAGEASELIATLYHDGERVHEVRKIYKIFSAGIKSEPLTLAAECRYLGGEADYAALRTLLPGCRVAHADDLEHLPEGGLLVIGSRIRDEDGRIERGVRAFAARGGRLLILEQDRFSIGRLTLSRRDFIRAHSGSYDHPVLAGFGDEDLMFWDPELREDGPVPIITAAFEKPAAGDYRLLLECSAGDFGDGGDLWTPLLEYRGGRGYMLASQLGLTSRFARVPQAALLLRRLLIQAAGARPAAAAPASPGAERLPVRFLGARGGMNELFLSALRLPYEPLRRGSDLAALAARFPSGDSSAARTATGRSAPPEPAAPSSGGSGPEDGAPPAGALSAPPGLLLIEPGLLRETGAPEAARAFAEAGGTVLVLPCDETHGEALSRLLDRPVTVTAHETYQLEADYACPPAAGLSPADLFGLDKVHLSPRDVENLPLGLHRIEASGVRAVCVSVEGTAWKDYFVRKRTAEYSRLALVELNRDHARKPGNFVVGLAVGAGSIVCSQIPLRPALDKSLRLYARLLANLGAAFEDGLWNSVKSDGQLAVESMMALPCEPYRDEEAMRAYYADPQFTLNNLGEGLYGWMKKKERSPRDGLMRIGGSAGGLWFLSAFVEVPEAEDPADRAPLPQAGQTSAEHDAPGRPARLRLAGNPVSAEAWLNGEALAPPYDMRLLPGFNRLIVAARGGEEDIRLGVFFEHPDGRPMDDLRYRMTIDEIDPK